MLRPPRSFPVVQSVPSPTFPLLRTVPQAGSTVYSTCVATKVVIKSKANRKHVRRGKSVVYGLKVANKVEKGLCLENLCVRVDLPDEARYAKSRLAPPTLLRNLTISSKSWGQGKPSVAGRLVRENGTTSVLWSGVSLAPGRSGRFSVKMRVLSGPDGRPGTLAIGGSVYQCMDSTSCKTNVSPTPVRIWGWDG